MLLDAKSIVSSMLLVSKESLLFGFSKRIVTHLRASIGACHRFIGKEAQVHLLFPSFEWQYLIELADIAIP
jgi:hypothetical protein